MKESRPSVSGAAMDDGRVWVMKHFTGTVLLQYNSLDEFIADRVAQVHDLPQSFYGTGHVIYGAAVYYHRAGTDLIDRSLLNNSTLQCGPTNSLQCEFSSDMLTDRLTSNRKSAGLLHSVGYTSFIHILCSLYEPRTVIGWREQKPSAIHPLLLLLLLLLLRAFI